MTDEELRALMRDATITMAEAGSALDKFRQQAEADPIYRQHRIFCDVMFTFQRSRWPWVRWTAKKMQEEIIYRLAMHDKARGTEASDGKA